MFHSQRLQNQLKLVRKLKSTLLPWLLLSALWRRHSKHRRPNGKTYMLTEEDNSALLRIDPVAQ